jgi:CheY-like chemotaxis protein
LPNADIPDLEMHGTLITWRDYAFPALEYSRRGTFIGLASARGTAQRSERSTGWYAGFALSPPQRRVLVVEDNCVIASLLTDQLNEFGYVVLGPAAKLADATAIASTSALDCALIDIALGEESALPVAQILRDRHIPFVFMTGASESPEGKWHDVPALLKPFTFEELRRALQHLLSEPDETPKSGL